MSINESIPSIFSVQVGLAIPLGPEQVMSGFVKHAINGSIKAKLLGLEGDEQADLTVHGGPDKAIYLYPKEHYPRWIQEVPHHETKLKAGAFGENVTTRGLDENSISIGDVLRLGSAEVQVTQPRQPCYKLGLRFEDNRLGKIMMRSGRTGWYVRVLKEGTLKSGDSIEVINQSEAGWTISRFNSFIMSRRNSRQDLQELAVLDGLAKEWKESIVDALQS